MKDLKDYESPSVEIVDVQVEKGFAVSGKIVGSMGQGSIEDWLIQ